MIEEKYTRENNTNYVLIESKENDTDKNYQVKMLKKNTIERFLPLSIRCINNSEVYYYDITSKQLINRIYEGNSIIWEDVENICISIDAVIKIVNEYMLELDSVVLNPRFMYINISNKEIYFIYYPNHELDFFKSLRELFEFILEHLNHSDRNTVMRVYEIYQKILQNEYDLKSIITKILQEEKKDSIDAKNTNNINNEGKDSTIEQVNKSYVIPTVLSEEVTSEKEIYNEKIKKIIIAIKVAIILINAFLLLGIVMPKYLIFKMNLVLSIIVILILAILYRCVNEFYNKNKMNFTKIITQNEFMSYEIRDSEIQRPKHEDVTEETSDICGTMLLSDYMENGMHKEMCRLIPSDTQNEGLQTIEIGNFPFIIGSFQPNSNYAIDNTVVSRIHLRILHYNDTYSIEDLNSTNGTFVNGQRLNNCEPVEIQNNDTIRIASLEYHIEIN